MPTTKTKSKPASIETEETAPARSKQRTPLNINALLKKLEKLGAAVDETTIQNWARKSIISASTPQQPDKGKVGHRRKTGNKGGRRALYPPKAFEEAAAAWSVIEAARERGQRLPTTRILRTTKTYAREVYTTYTTDFEAARTIKTVDWIPHPSDLPKHLTPLKGPDIFIPFRHGVGAFNYTQEFNRILTSAVDGEGKNKLVKGLCLRSAEYHPRIVAYVCGWAKALRGVNLRVPTVVDFVWVGKETCRTFGAVLALPRLTERNEIWLHFWPDKESKD